MTGPGEGPRGRPGDRAGAARALAPDRDGHVGDGDPQRDRVAVRPRTRRRAVRGRRAAGPRPRGGRDPAARAGGRPATTRTTRRRRAAALRARPSGGHPGRAEGPVRGRRRPRLLLDPVQQPRAGGRGRSARGAERRPARRARVLGAPGGAGGTQPRRAARVAPARERQRVDVRRRARPHLVRRARRTAAPGRPARARGDRGDLGGDRGRAGDPRRRQEPEGPSVGDRDGHVRPRGATGAELDLPAPRTVRAPRRRPAHRGRTRGGRGGTRRALPGGRSRHARSSASS